MADVEDDWFYESIHMYKNLYMYDLQQPVTAMDWIDGGSRLCVAVSDGRKHELAEMALPDKVLRADEENSGLVKDRDFRMVNGGFCNYPVTAIKHIPNSRLVCTCPKTKSDSDSVDIWQLGKDDTDLIEQICNLKNPNPKGDKSKTTTFHDGSIIVFGSHLDNICMVDVKRREIIKFSLELKEIEKTELVSAIHILDGNRIMCCCQNSGDILILDTREKFKPVSSFTNHNEPKANFWTQDTRKDYDATSVLQLSSTGHLNVLDLRNLTSNVGCFRTELDGNDNTDLLTIKASENNKEQFSISGFDSSVYVYSSDIVKSTVSYDQKLDPVFIHEGHLKNCSHQSNNLAVVTHMWHPCQPDLILSAANDGSLHSWQYNKRQVSKS